MTTPQQTELAAVLILKDEMSAPLQKAKGQLNQLGTAFQGVQQKANQALKPMSAATASAAASTQAMANAFERSERAQVNMVRRIGNVTNRLLALHFVAGQLGDSFARGSFGVGIKSATSALGTFTGIAAAMPNKIGLAIGAVGGLGAAYAQVKAEIDAIEQKQKKLQAALTKNLKAVTDAAASKTFQATMAMAEGKTPEQVKLVQDIAANEARLLQIYQQQASAVQELQVLEMNRENMSVTRELQMLRLLDRKKKLQEQIDAFQRMNLPGAASAPARQELAAINEQIKALELVTKKEGERIQQLSTNLEGLAENEKEAADAARELLEALEGLEELKLFSDQQSKLFDEAFEVGQALQAGLISPLEAANKQLEIAEKKMALIIRMGDMAPSGARGQTEQELDAARFEAGNLAEFQRTAEEQQKVQQQIEEEMERALEDYRRQWEHLFEHIGQGFSDVFADAIVEGKSLTKGLQGLFKDLQKNLIRMVMDTMLGSMFRSVGAAFGNTMAPLFGMAPGGGAPGAAPGAAPGQAPGIPPSVNLMALGGGAAAGGGMSAFNWGLAPGSAEAIGMAGFSAVGTAAGGYVMNRGIQSASPGTSAAGGALAGAAMGAVFGPVGIAVGAIAGAALGWYSGNEAKEEEEKMKERQRAAEEEARKRHEEMVEKAKGLIKLHVRTNMGGGLATEEAMADVSGLFSNDISADEVEQFGAENVVARQAEIEAGARSQNIDVGGIVVNAQVSGNYDVQRLAESLGYYIRRSIPGE